MPKIGRRDELLESDFMMTKITHREVNGKTFIHWHNVFEIVYLLEGELYLMDDRDSNGIMISEGDAVLIPPGHEHDIGMNEAEATALILQFHVPEVMRTKHGNEKSFTLLSDKNHGVRIIRKQDRFSQQVTFLCREIHRIRQEKEPLAPDSILGAVQMLLPYFDARIQILPNISCQNEKDYFDLIKICDYIDEVGFVRVTVDMVAEYMGYSKKYFSLKFKEITGKGFKQFLDQLKMQEARRMLGEGKSATEVAELLGYSCVQNFSHAFKRIHAVTIKEMMHTHR